MKKYSLSFPKKRVLFTTQLNVHIGLINYGGHLGNDSFLTILHEARIQYLRSMNYSETDISGHGILIKDAQIEYKQQVLYGQTLECRIAVDDVSRSSCAMYYALYLLEENIPKSLVCLARTTIVFIDIQEKKISPIPEDFLSRIL